MKRGIIFFVFLEMSFYVNRNQNKQKGDGTNV